MCEHVQLSTRVFFDISTIDNLWLFIEALNNSNPFLPSRLLNSANQCGQFYIINMYTTPYQLTAVVRTTSSPADLTNLIFLVILRAFIGTNSLI